MALSHNFLLVCSVPLHIICHHSSNIFSPKSPSSSGVQRRRHAPIRHTYQPKNPSRPCINVCGQGVDNPIIRTATHGDIGQDVVSLQSTDGSNPGKVVKVPNFIFTCGATLLVRGLANGVTGMAGLGRSKIALSTQLAADFSFKRKFALWLSSSTTSDENGIIIFGDRPTASAFSLGDKSFEYFIGVKSVNVNGKAIPLNKTLLSIDNNGIDGTKISTVDPYTVLETSIYNAVVSAFVNGMPTVKRVSSVAPFGACFDSRDIFTTRISYAVPWIDLVLQNHNVKFSVTGANSMVRVSDNVLCLGFVDGGVNPRTSIVVGGYQLENNLLQFDLAKGFGGTKISTVHPYTVLETSIYNALTRAFIKATANITRVSPASPFTVCCNSTFSGSTRVGPAVPQIDLVFQSSSVVWRIFGANSMVQVKSDVSCLGFVDGGVNPRTSIVIGGHQLEENLVQIDLAASKVGFSSILFFRQTSCSNFNFTSNA
ncbi:hypothetical protein Dsin_029526 [Dipteronia sinensis]|uniref:Peptidase A1 domain-containing protein n=1 Tax=Dipteronia sinensis TaxID=43782 RepID=A0AAD9ZT94_9ROSI|nr:hypothetical protein Dsin_029526 [Dipteronia sinensis]